MVSQRKTRNKIPCQGFRRSSRLSSLNSRPKLDIVIGKSQQKTQSIENGYNLGTQPTSLSESKISTSRKPQGGRSRGRPAKTKSSANVPRRGNSQSSTADRGRDSRSSLASRKKSLPEYSLPTDDNNNNSQKSHSQFSTDIESSFGNDRQQELFAKLSLSSAVDDDMKSPPPPLFKACSFSERMDFDGLKWSQSFKNHLMYRAADKTVKASDRPEQKRHPKKGAKVKNLPTKTDDAQKKIKKESRKAERPFDSESKKPVSRVAKKVRDPPKLLKIKNPKREVQKSELSSVDELCTLFETCKCTSRPRYFVTDEKLSLGDCVPKLRTRNDLSQKVIELNASKGGKVKKQLPNLIPIIFKQDLGATFPDEVIRNGPTESMMNSEDYLDIRNILKSITHIRYEAPYYVPYEEDWYEGFDCWGNGE